MRSLTLETRAVCGDAVAHELIASLEMPTQPLWDFHIPGDSRMYLMRAGRLGRRNGEVDRFEGRPTEKTPRAAKLLIPRPLLWSLRPSRCRALLSGECLLLSAAIGASSRDGRSPRDRVGLPSTADGADNGLGES